MLAPKLIYLFIPILLLILFIFKHVFRMSDYGALELVLEKNDVVGLQILLRNGIGLRGHGSGSNLPWALVKMRRPTSSACVQAVLDAVPLVCPLQKSSYRDALAHPEYGFAFRAWGERLPEGRVRPLKLLCMWKLCSMYPLYTRPPGEKRGARRIYHPHLPGANILPVELALDVERMRACTNETSEGDMRALCKCAHY
jgi:hypothetical protein